jgi:hypothetical protein
MEPRKMESWGLQDHPHGVARAKPTVGRGRPAAVLGTPRRVSRTPPGSASGACLHRGESGPGESPWSPWGIAGVGGPTVEGQTPGVARRRPPRLRAWREPGTPSQRRAPRHRGRRGSPARPREGPWAVFAEHRTAGWERCAPGRDGGAPLSQGPPGGQAKPGITVAGRTSGRDSGRTNRLHATPEHGPPGHALSGAGVQHCVALA